MILLVFLSLLAESLLEPVVMVQLGGQKLQGRCNTDSISADHLLDSHPADSQ